MAFSSFALAAGNLNLYNWGNYTNPELIKKFEQKFDVKMTITDYDSNATALAKVKAGGHGFDMVVPSANYVKIFVEEDLVLEVRPDQMENFKYVAPEWRNPPWDPGRKYSVPWQWGTGSAPRLTQRFIKATSTRLPSFLIRPRNWPAR